MQKFAVLTNGNTSNNIIIYEVKKKYCILYLLPYNIKVRVHCHGSVSGGGGNNRHGNDEIKIIFNNNKGGIYKYCNI